MCSLSFVVCCLSLCVVVVCCCLFVVARWLLCVRCSLMLFFLLGDM